jgi:hypothetical protein
VETSRRVGRCLTARARRNQVNMSRPGRARRRQHNVRVASSHWDQRSPAARPSTGNCCSPSVRSGYSSLRSSFLAGVYPWGSYKDRIAYCACLRLLHPRRWPCLLRGVHSVAAFLPPARSSARAVMAPHRLPLHDTGERHQRQSRLWVDFENGSSPSTLG